MGFIQQKPYKVKRNGEWITITPEPKQYVSGIGRRGGRVKNVQPAKNTTK